MIVRIRVALLPLMLLAFGCGGSGESYPQAWTLDVSPEAIELVEAISWDAEAFYTLVCDHAERIADGSGLTFELGDASGGDIKGVITAHGTGADERGVLGSAIRGTGRAELNMGELFNHMFGHAPARVALISHSMDDAARLVAVVVAHEVGHAMALSHNAQSMVMRALPVLEVSERHAFTLEEIEQILRVTRNG